LSDPAETITQQPGQTTNVYVPFHSVTGKTTDGSSSEFFDTGTTNEDPFARTRPDGTGQDFFEVQTAREAAGLGCGEPLKSGAKTVGRSCWLVIVPRNNIEVDGSVRGTSSTEQLQSSPLSTTNWSHRIVVKLQFEPLGDVCPIGAAERRTVGHEPIAEAISRW